MKMKPLGNTKLKVSVMGLSCMALSQFYGVSNEKEAINILHRAESAGINFFEAGDIDGTGTNEAILASAFKQQWNKIILATKVSLTRDPANLKCAHLNASADYIKAACDASLKRLGIDVIDLYYLHRLDHTMLIEESIGALADLVTAGKVRYIGLGEVSARTLQKANEIHPITALQSDYSLWTREPEKEIIPLCEKLNVSFVASNPFGKGVKSHNLALAWILAKSPHAIPISQTKSCQFLKENIAAIDIQLTEDDLIKLDNLFISEAVSGDCYA